MRTPNLDLNALSKRRAAVASKIKGGALVIPAHPEYIRNNDCHYPYRADSNMMYLTGFDEPGCVFVLRPGKQPESTMFVLPKDVDKETWTGFRYGPDAAKKLFGFDDAKTVEKVEEELFHILRDVDTVYYSMFINREFDQVMSRLIERIQLAKSRTNKGHLSIVDPRALIGEMRLIKTDKEIEALRKAADISSAAHIDVMKACRPGVNERALHGVFLRSIMERGCAREGYNSIVATGANATTLHYVFNDQTCKDGELLLVDAGGEYEYYTADITRTFPVNGKFNADQRRVYQNILTLQKDLVAKVRPGTSREELQKGAIAGLVDIMIDEKLLRGRKEDLIEKKEYLKFYPHGVGHWLGMDVHDSGSTEVNGEPRQLAAGVVVTIEPGLYVPYDAPGVPDSLRGLGIRIEDDVLVTATGQDVLTKACPKEISEMEALIGTGPRN